MYNYTLFKRWYVSYMVDIACRRGGVNWKNCLKILSWFHIFTVYIKVIDSIIKAWFLHIAILTSNVWKCTYFKTYCGGVKCLPSPTFWFVLLHPNPPGLHAFINQTLRLLGWRKGMWRTRCSHQDPGGRGREAHQENTSPRAPDTADRE